MSESKGRNYFRYFAIIGLCVFIGLSVCGCSNPKMLTIGGTMLYNGMPDDNFTASITFNDGKTIIIKADVTGAYSIKVVPEELAEINLFYKDELSSGYHPPFKEGKDYSTAITTEVVI